MARAVRALHRSIEVLEGIGLRGVATLATGKVKVKGLPKPVFIRNGTSDLSVLIHIFVDKDYGDPSPAHSKAVKAFYSRTVEQGKVPVIVDCGANIGLSAVWYANLYPKARIFAVEPQPENFAVLLKNTAPYPNIVPVQAGISSRATRLQLAAGGGDWGWQTVEHDTGEVETVTIPDLLGRGGVPFIVKIDIEGFETTLFEDNVSWVRQIPVIVYESHDWMLPWRGTAHSIASVLTSQGKRDYVQLRENMFSYSHELLRSESPDQK